MIINDIRFEGRELWVGITDPQRWQWELDDGARGGDAKTLAAVVLTDRGRRTAPGERIELWISRVDPLRPAVLAAIPALLEVAWEAFEARRSEDETRANLFGRRLES